MLQHGGKSYYEEDVGRSTYMPATWQQHGIMGDRKSGVVVNSQQVYENSYSDGCKFGIKAVDTIISPKNKGVEYSMKGNGVL